MQSIKKIAVVLGARPNFIKAAPFLKRAAIYSDFKVTVIHTGQHFDANMSKVFFDQLGIKEPDVMLQIKGERHTEKIGKMFNALQVHFLDHAYDAVIVFGDVNSTLAGAIAASKHSRLVHIEAGLRSHDRRMPEEINRVIVDHLADLLFTTEPSANENLVLEGISPEKIRFVGNLMIESIELYWPHIATFKMADSFALSPRAYIVSTIHRQENTDSRAAIQRMFEFLQRVAQQQTVVIPLHPGTKRKLEEYGLSSLLEGLRVVDPLGYFEFISLVSTSKGVITDSGGIQEETTHLGIPCCTLRDNTERPITIERGSNMLCTPSADDMPRVMAHLERRDFQPCSIPLWDKDVSQRIFDHLIPWLYRC